ncbi:MAG: hypothetical protein KGL18_02190 [Burkholderiales bacterium]|nr:hypothetical protein [Burkholderiales bacterium]MDE1928272.1 hypothetical protein [Burkholderiales bacterium]MDE2158792.1 hypothetical protein [Burkholderiales bacterium]MDE2501778.1 hypothetical protein [Burkholderiales bacterium]
MPTASAPRSQAEPDGAQRLRGRLMQHSLRKLLDQVRGARDVLPHLAALEVSLGKRGVAVIDEIAHPTLVKICSQLSNLPLPGDDAALQDLLKRLLDALDGRPEQPHYRSTFHSDSKMMVSEVTPSAFDAARLEQATTQRGGLDA